MNDSISSLASAGMPSVQSGCAAKTSGSRQEIAGAAQQFEALMLNQLLQSAFTADKENGLGGGEEDQAGMQAIQLAQEHFASALAVRGGLGLARMIVSGLLDESGQNATDASCATDSANPTQRTTNQ